MLLTTSGCSIRQEISPIKAIGTKQVCIIENPTIVEDPAVKQGFLDAYESALIAKGYSVKRLAASASTDGCAVTTTYKAGWEWDLSLYMAYAEIDVYSNGKSIGHAVYDSRTGDANLAKFINAEKKVAELVNGLYPDAK
jgi:capsid portal protein